MSTLNDLKTEYQNKLDTQAAEQAQRDLEIEAMRQLKLDGLRPRIITWLANREGVDETELSQYGEVKGNWSSMDVAKLNYAYFTLTLDEHQPVWYAFYEDKEHAIRSSSDWWKVEQSGRSPETLGEALTLAAQVYQQNQEYLAREAEESREYQTQKVDREYQEGREHANRMDTLIELANDPIAFRLLKLFAEIQKERLNLREEIDNLSETLNNTEYHYDSELSATRSRIEKKQQEVERVKDEARSLQYRVYDLDSELKKVQRQRRGGSW